MNHEINKKENWFITELHKAFNRPYANNLYNKPVNNVQQSVQVLGNKALEP